MRATLHDGQLPVSTVAHVRTIAQAAADHDLVAPLGEQTHLDLAEPTAPARHLTVGEPPVGYAALDLRGHPTVELVVAPTARGRGLGRSLLDAARDAARGAAQASGADAPLVWAHGNLPAARALASSAGLSARRELWQMTADLEPRSPAGLPDDVVVRSFVVGQDEEAWLEVNARAFADHPEQGRMTREDLRARQRETWFRADDVLLAERAGRLAGFAWLKVTGDVGELYVLGVDPTAQGGGLGRRLTALALDHLTRRGARTGVLYTEATNAAAVNLYTAAGFRRSRVDVQYGRLAQPPPGDATIYTMTAQSEAHTGEPAHPGEPEALETIAAEPEALTEALEAPTAEPEALTEALEAPTAEPEALTEATAPATTDALPDGRFGDRELDWLAFNERVLEMAEDTSLPLLERVRFLAIFASNLDEFVMVRVAGLKRRIATGMAVTAASGLSPHQVLDAISVRAHELMARHAEVFTSSVRPALGAEGITLVHWEDLGADEQERLRKFFRRQIYPVLTPLAVDPAHPFPYISGLSLNLAVVVVNPTTGKEHFARVKVPPLLPRFIAVDARGRPSAPSSRTADLGRGPTSFVPLEDVIAVHLDALFPGMEVREHHTFRVTRNEDVEVEEDDAENILQAMEKELLRRRFGPAVRLEVARDIAPRVRDLLVRELGVEESEVFELPAPLDLTGLNLIADLDRPELSYERFIGGTHRHLAEVESATATNIFSAIRRRDILLHHPYDSFATSVQAFLAQAAADPNVLAIKQTLYRTSGDSPIVDSLIDAAEAGKQVLALVEIKARFDEQANISWARKLEQAGVHVVYGIVGLKTHCKLSLVVRQESEGLRRYCHVGTGNYNPKTARLYEDLGVLTCDPEVGQDLSRLFNQLSGYAPKARFNRLLVAPRTMRAGLIEKIKAEVVNHRAGTEAWIRIKVNSIVDEATIDALYRASQAGVPVDLQVRGTCAVRPGVPGLSETIRVRSILGRFLEHARLFAFAGGGDPTVYIGSADLMHRNLDRRVETVVRITDPEHVAELLELLDLSMDDGTASWQLKADGTWQRHHLDADGAPLRDLQEFLIARQRRRAVRDR